MLGSDSTEPPGQHIHRGKCPCASWTTGLGHFKTPSLFHIQPLGAARLAQSKCSQSPVLHMSLLNYLLKRWLVLTGFLPVCCLSRSILLWLLLCEYRSQAGMQKPPSAPCELLTVESWGRRATGAQQAEAGPLINILECTKPHTQQGSLHKSSMSRS